MGSGASKEGKEQATQERGAKIQTKNPKVSFQIESTSGASLMGASLRNRSSFSVENDEFDIYGPAMLVVLLI